MPHLDLENVCLDYPVADAKASTLRGAVAAVSTGGAIRRMSSSLIVIEALRDITLFLRQGDRVALIGRNGAGKSTLLRVLAGIYEPVKGKISRNGKIAPLFDVSLGMEPDETGYNNVRLAGILRGLSNREVNAHLEEINEFTELGDYLRLPIRTYSTGMLVRLGFAVATLGAPDILLLDEVINTGDRFFEKKAQDRILSLMEKSRIIVLASHSEKMMRRFCDRAVLLHQGELIEFGPIDTVWKQYQKYE